MKADGRSRVSGSRERDRMAAELHPQVHKSAFWRRCWRGGTFPISGELKHFEFFFFFLMLHNLHFCTRRNLNAPFDSLRLSDSQSSLVSRITLCSFFFFYKKRGRGSAVHAMLFTRISYFYKAQSSLSSGLFDVHHHNHV